MNLPVFSRLTASNESFAFIECRNEKTITKKNYPWIGRKKVCPLSYVQTLIFIVVERIITIFLPIHSPLICSPNSSSFWKLMDARNTIKFWIYVLNKILSLIDHFNELQALSHFFISMNSFFLYCISSFFRSLCSTIYFMFNLFTSIFCRFYLSFIWTIWNTSEWYSDTSLEISNFK